MRNGDHFKRGFKGSVDLPPEQRPKGTGYVGFQPADSAVSARKRRAGKGRASKRVYSVEMGLK